MRVLPPRRAVVLISALAFMSCDSATSPNLVVETTIGLKETFLSPRDIQRVALYVYPLQGDPIKAAYFLFSGNIFNDSIALPLSGDQDQIGYVDFTVAIAPITGTVNVTGVVITEHGRGTADTSFTIGDDGVPEVGLDAVPPVVAPGDSIPSYCSGWDRSGFLEVRLDFTGAVDTTLTASDPSFPQSYALGAYILVPASAPIGGSIYAVCTMTDIYGHAVSTPPDTVLID